MSHPPRAIALALFILPILLAPARYVAAQAVQPLRLDYKASAGCPERGAFIAQVRARTPLANFVNDDSKAALLVVSVQAGRSGATGRVGVGLREAREVSAQSCADVVAALALITALTIDPNASAAPVGTTGGAAALGAPYTEVDGASQVAEAERPVGADAAKPKERDAEKKSPQKPADQEDEPDEDEPDEDESDEDAASEEEPESPSVPARWFWGPGARFDAASGASEGSLSFYGLSVWLEGGAQLSPAFVPTLRLSGRYAVSPQSSQGSGLSQFSLLSGRLDFSPVRISLRDFALGFYVSFEIGALSGSSESTGEIAASDDRQQLLLALGQGGFVELSLYGPIYAAVYVELHQALRRYRFVFDEPAGSIAIAELPVLELAAGLGLGMRFW